MKSTPAGEAITLVSPVNASPLDYFAKACARCHGPNGSAYGESFGEGLTEHELVEVVDEMAIGPANWPLNEEELDVQVAFHRSMLRKTPFIVWNYREGNTLRGEVLPGSRVEIESESGIVEARINHDQWQATLPDGWAESRITLRAIHSQGRTEVQLASHAFSHHEPLD